MVNLINMASRTIPFFLVKKDSFGYGRRSKELWLMHTPKMIGKERLEGMRKPIFIRPLTQDEYRQIREGLHSSDAFVLRRCQILLASARGERAPAIAHQLSCDDQTVRNVIKGFNTTGLIVLQTGSSRPRRLRTAFTEEGCQRLQGLLHCSPHDFGYDHSLWTLELLAQACFEQGITTVQVSSRSVRRALGRLKTSWKSARQWMSSPGPQDLPEKTLATG